MTTFTNKEEDKCRAKNANEVDRIHAEYEEQKKNSEGRLLAKVQLQHMQKIARCLQNSSIFGLPCCFSHQKQQKNIQFWQPNAAEKENRQNKTDLNTTAAGFLQLCIVSKVGSTINIKLLI